jgi:hypothetical protein
MRFSLVSAMLTVLAWAGTTGMAFAGCREDLAAADRNLRKAHAGFEKRVGQGTDAVKCSAYKRLVAALSDQRAVIDRCDTGPNHARNVQDIDRQIASISPQMNEVCK